MTFIPSQAMLAVSAIAEQLGANVTFNFKPNLGWRATVDNGCDCSDYRETFDEALSYLNLYLIDELHSRAGQSKKL
jgi:hypothetical protein